MNSKKNGPVGAGPDGAAGAEQAPCAASHRTTSQTELQAPCEAIYHALLNYPQLTAADLRVYAALLQLGPAAYRDDIAKSSGHHRSTVTAALANLQKVGLVQIDRRQVKKGECKTKNFYEFPQIAKSPDGDIAPQKSARAKSPDGDIAPQKSAHNGAKSPDGDPMFKLIDLKGNRSEILKLLDFIGDHTLRRRNKGGEALIDLPHMSLELAQAAHEWYYGGFDPPNGPIPEEKRAGYMVTCIRENEIPPRNKQLALAESTYEAEGLVVAGIDLTLTDLKRRVSSVWESRPGNGANNKKACRNNNLIERVIQDAIKKQTLTRHRENGWSENQIVDYLAGQIDEHLASIPVKSYRGY